MCALRSESTERKNKWTEQYDVANGSSNKINKQEEWIEEAKDYSESATKSQTIKMICKMHRQM